jgi:hypothetical protein
MLRKSGETPRVGLPTAPAQILKYILSLRVRASATARRVELEPMRGDPGPSPACSILDQLDHRFLPNLVQSGIRLVEGPVGIAGSFQEGQGQTASLPGGEAA